MKAPILHAGLLALRLDGAWRGALICGPSGSGKSDLALRALRSGFRLIADDRTVVFASAGRLFGRAPPPLAGRIEVRGQGVLSAAFLPLAEIVLVARCGPAEIEERLPGPILEEVAGVTLPVLPIAALNASAPDKLRLALSRLGASGQQAYQAPLRPGGTP